MGRGKHTEAQIIEALKQVEAGRKVEEVSRQYGVSKHTMYGWKAKYGGLEVSEAQEIKQLRDENSRLKRPAKELTTQRTRASIAAG
jgi:putative transposase